jgi:MFS transporter, DHA1 family, multidrug resistance protein
VQRPLTRQSRSNDSQSRGSVRRAALTDRPAKLLLVVGSLCVFGPLCVDMYLPALPKIAADLRTSTSSVQLSLTACLVGIAIGQILIGPLSDRFGRKRPLVIGLLLFIGASFACAFAPGIAVLTGFRLLQGIGGAAGIVTSNAVVRDLFSGVRAARFFSRLLLVIGLGPVLAPQIGAELLRLSSWRGVFIALCILGSLLLLLAMTELPETLPLERRRVGGLAETLTSMREVLSDRTFLANALCAGLGFGAVFCYVSASSFVLENIYGLSPQRFSLVFAANAVGLISASQVNARFVGRFGSSRMLSAGVVTLGCGALWLLLSVLFVSRDLFAVLPPLFLVVTSVGLVAPNATALALNDFPDSAGSASAVLGLLQFGIGALVAPLVGLDGSHDARPMALLIVLLALGSSGCRLWTRQQTRQPSEIMTADAFGTYQGLEPPS